MNESFREMLDLFLVAYLGKGVRYQAKRCLTPLLLQGISENDQQYSQEPLLFRSNPQPSILNTNP